MAKTQESGTKDIPDHIEQIRDIILGPQKRENDQRFEKILAEMQLLRSESQGRIDELRESLQAKISTGLNALEHEIRQIGLNLREEASDIRKEVNETSRTCAKDITDTRSRLQAELRQTADQLSRNIEAHASAALERDISKEALAEFLEELAMRVKGVDFINELKKAASKKSGD